MYHMDHELIASGILKNNQGISMRRGGRRPGAGRPKGAPNKITADLKGMILGALDDAGGQAYLTLQATENPGPFLTLIGKVLPTTLAGDPENPVHLNHTIDAPAKESREEWLARRGVAH